MTGDARLLLLILVILTIVSLITLLSAPAFPEVHGEVRGLLAKNPNRHGDHSD